MPWPVGPDWGVTPRELPRRPRTFAFHPTLHPGRLTCSVMCVTLLCKVHGTSNSTAPRSMRILRAVHLGMCFGVRDAIALALEHG